MVWIIKANKTTQLALLSREEAGSGWVKTEYISGLLELILTWKWGTGGGEGGQVWYVVDEWEAARALKPWLLVEDNHEDVWKKQSLYTDTSTWDWVAPMPGAVLDKYKKRVQEVRTHTSTEGVNFLE